MSEQKRPTGEKWRAFAEKMDAGSEPETSMLAVGPCAIHDDSSDLSRFVASQVERGFPVSVDGALTLDGLALVSPPGVARCAVCDTPEPPDAYEAGWRSQTCDEPPDFHALLCPACQQHGGDS